MRQEAEPATAEIDEVAPGILRMQLPLRMPGLGHVNCYALEDEKGFTLVDPGMPGPQAWKILIERFKLAGFDLRHVHTVVVTHSHIDHFGASGRLRLKAGAQVVTSSTFRTWWDPTDVGEEELEQETQPDPRAPWKMETSWGGKHPRPPPPIRRPDRSRQGHPTPSRRTPRQAQRSRRAIGRGTRRRALEASLPAKIVGTDGRQRDLRPFGTPTARRQGDAARRRRPVALLPALKKTVRNK